MFHPVRAALAAFALAIALAHPPAARADADPIFVIEFADGAIRPSVLKVPAGTRFKLELHNRGTSPIEFESLPLRKEKVLGPGVSTFIVIRRLDPGEYLFFDDFHLDMPPAKLIAE